MNLHCVFYWLYFPEEWKEPVYKTSKQISLCLPKRKPVTLQKFLQEIQSVLEWLSPILSTSMPFPGRLHFYSPLLAKGWGASEPVDVCESWRSFTTFCSLDSVWISGKGTSGPFSFTFHRRLLNYKWTYVFGVFLLRVTQILSFFLLIFNTYSQMESCSCSLIPV